VDYLKALWSNANSAYFRQAASERDCELFLVGALLHDLGQYPFAHAFEESETQKQLFSHELLTERLILAQLTTDIVDQSQLNLFDEAGADYWSALDKLLRDSKGRYVFDIISDEWGLDPSDVVSLLGSGRVGEALSYPSKVVDTLRDAINGPIDVDKVDYIRRDSYHLGFPARLDVYGLIGDLAVSDRNGQMRLTISEGGVPAAQDLHVARYRLFTDVYWDRVSRSAERMLRYSVDTLRSLLGDEEFSRIFFLKVLTNSDTPLIEALKHEAYSYSGTEMGKMRGCVEILDRVQRRNLHLEGTVLDASRDEKQHKVLCEMWVNALKTSDGEDAFRSLTSWVRKSIGDKLSRPVAEHEVFFDIPHASTDQPSKYDVYVHSRNGEARSISEFSPMWRSFSDMFKLHGRKVRLFVAPELWDLIDEKICRSAIEDALGRRGSKKAGHS
jgi:HD superfamily phosphohydrolase